MRFGGRRGMVGCRFRAGTAALAAVACLLAGAAMAADGPAAPGERTIKAAFLYRFLGYTDFPPDAFADAGAPLLIGVAYADEVAGELARIAAGRSVGSRPVQVRPLRDEDAGASVHLLFVGGADCARAARVIRAAPRSLLVVTECDSGVPAGSVINFTVAEERVRFDVSLDAAERNGIRLSSRLLSVANHVQKGAP